MLKISSRDNQRIKQAQKVRDSLTKTAVFVEGVRLAEEALRSNLQISDVFFTVSFAESERGKTFLDAIEKHHLAEVSEKVFSALSDTKSPQGVILIGEKPVTGKKIIEISLRTNSQKTSLVVLLHQINNPVNQGAILRTCEAVGASGVVLTKNSADVFSPKALRGAMGASMRVPIWTGAEFHEVIEWARKINLTSVCADINAEKSFWEIDWKMPRLLIFGSEAHGLTEDERSMIDESLIIPMENQVESLNLAVACGIVLYEAKRQRN